jgi:hypothetical protein
MKRRFHKKDLFSYAHLLKVLAFQENFTIIDATEDVFYGYGSFLDKNYNNYKIGTINNNHIFKCDDFEGEELTITCKTHDGTEEVVQDMLKTVTVRSAER